MCRSPKQCLCVSWWPLYLIVCTADLQYTALLLYSISIWSNLLFIRRFTCYWNICYVVWWGLYLVSIRNYKMTILSKLLSLSLFNLDIFKNIHVSKLYINWIGLDWSNSTNMTSFQECKSMKLKYYIVSVVQFKGRASLKAYSRNFSKTVEVFRLS